MLALLEEAEAELEAKDTAVGGPITIAAFATAARGLAPQAIAALRKQYPQLAITFHEQEPGESIPKLVRRDVDLIIINDWQNAPLALPEGLTKAPLFDDIADIALPPGHRLGRSKAVRLSELSGEEWIAWQPGTICHDFLLHTLRKEGHEPRITHTAGEYATQLALVAAGLGACILPRLGRGPVPKGVTVVPSEPALRRHVYAAWRTHATRRSAIRAAVEQFQIAGKELARQFQDQRSILIDPSPVRIFGAACRPRPSSIAACGDARGARRALRPRAALRGRRRAADATCGPSRRWFRHPVRR